jgi:hypothetical protein
MVICDCQLKILNFAAADLKTRFRAAAAYRPTIGAEDCEGKTKSLDILLTEQTDIDFDVRP